MNEKDNIGTITNIPFGTIDLSPGQTYTSENGAIICWDAGTNKISVSELGSISVVGSIIWQIKQILDNIINGKVKKAQLLLYKGKFEDSKNNMIYAIRLISRILYFINALIKLSLPQPLTDDNWNITEAPPVLMDGSGATTTIPTLGAIFTLNDGTHFVISSSTHGGPITQARVLLSGTVIDTTTLQGYDLTQITIFNNEPNNAKIADGTLE